MYYVGMPHRQTPMHSTTCQCLQQNTMHLKNVLIPASLSATLVFASPMGNTPSAREYLDRRAPGAEATLKDTGKTQYTTKITLDGQDYDVGLSTGISTSWVASSDSDASGKASGSESFIDRKIEGQTKEADLSFAGFKVPSQSYVISSPQPGGPKGELGLKIDRGQSKINSPLLHIFQQEQNPMRHTVAIQLGRSPEGGKLGIGASTVCKGIEDQPELKATSKMSDYQFVIDDFAAMVGDRLISAPEVSKTPNTMIAPELALNQVSEQLALEIYGDLGELKSVDGLGNVWLVPCSEKLRITFRFHGKEIDIHPLDATLEPKELGKEEIVKDGKKMCIGSFQPINVPNTELDLILGVPFLRNACALMNYGEKLSGNLGNDRYMQFLPTTEWEKGEKEFEEARSKM